MLKKTLVIATLCAAGLVLWPSGGSGEFANSFALRNALGPANCGIGDLAEEIVARPAFTKASTKTDIDGAEETPWD